MMEAQTDGKLTIYAAPLQRHTTVFYRNAYHQTFGGIDKYFTPFFEDNKKGGFTPKLLPELDATLNHSMTVVPQVLAKTPDFLVAFAKKANELGYPEININMGCPHPPVWRKGFGSGLLQHPTEVDDMLNGLYQQIPDIKCSVKMRIGVEDVHDWENIIPILNKYPLTEIIVHPRITKQFYKGTPHWDEFGKIAAATSHKLVANGDIDSLAAFKAIKEAFPFVDTVMIGRGWLQNPWLPQLITEKNIVDYGNMGKTSELFQNFFNLVSENVTDINVKRNLSHDFWHYLSENIQGGIKWRRALDKKTSMRSYPQMVEELLRNKWIKE